MHLYFKSIIIYFFLISSTVTIFAQGVSMSPTRMFFTGNPGETVSQTVTMHNNSDKDYVFNINIKDWNREEDGTKIYFEPGTLHHSNSNWVSTLETNINLPAKSSIEVLVTMTIPENASTNELTNSMLFFTQIGKQEDEVKHDLGIGIIAIFEFGLHLYYTPPTNQTNSLDIISIESKSNVKTNTEQVHIRVFNDGNRVNDASVELELTNLLSGEEIKLTPINISSMPGTYQTVIHNLPDDLKGEYLGVVIIKMAESNDLRIGEKTFIF